MEIFWCKHPFKHISLWYNNLWIYILNNFTEIRILLEKLKKDFWTHELFALLTDVANVPCSNLTTTEKKHFWKEAACLSSTRSLSKFGPRYFFFIIPWKEEFGFRVFKKLLHRKQTTITYDELISALLNLRRRFAG